ncbi:MAG: ABC transporter permease [Bacteroidetes bacterium]|nr:ABC transporter permease [Bacteroidota bacterium]
MSILSLVWSYLKAKPLNTVLNIVLLSLGVSVITLLLVVSRQLEQRVADNTKGIDLVVGAKGSPLQLILCNIFHIDFPTGNINLREAEKLANHRLVKSAIPLALGDSYMNFRIIGTSQAYPELYQAELQTGDWWKEELEVTLGANVAALTKLKVGSTFESAHGLTKEGHAHEESKYKVAGILKPSGSVIDNLILTQITSVWHVHQEGEEKINMDHTLDLKLIPGYQLKDSTKEITSLLLRYKNPIAAIQLPRFINTQTNMQAASPAFESARLFTILGSAKTVLMSLAYLLVFISALSIFIALYNSLKERKYDLAIMRSMGASRFKLWSSMVLEGVSLTFLGTIGGLFLAHIMLFVFLQSIGDKTGLAPFQFYLEEAYLLIGGVLLGLLCSLLPAWQAYRTDIHKVLAGN